MYDNIVFLIAEVKGVDQYGDPVTVETPRPVFADVRSIGQTEFYQAQAVGLRPEVKFVLPDFLEYQGEKKLSFADYGAEEPLTYEIIRTYRAGNEIELVCNRGLEE